MKSRSPILRYLQESFPTEEWSVMRWGFNWQYRTTSGWLGEWRSVLTPRYPDDDETAELQFFLYRPDKPPVRLYPPRRSGVLIADFI